MTSIQSPAIALPAGNLTLSFQIYLAHLNNATSADFVSVRVVGSNGVAQTVWSRGGRASNVAGSWATRTANLSAWAGQTVTLAHRSGGWRRRKSDRSGCRQHRHHAAMTGSKRRGTFWLLPWISAALVTGAAERPVPPLAFHIDEGQNLNYFLRQGPVAAHLLLRSGDQPRMLVAFPAGNSGVGLWFDKQDSPLTWIMVAPPKPLTIRDSRQRELHGIEFEVEVRSKELRTREAVLSSVRVLRDFELLGKAPAELQAKPVTAGNVITWSRDRLDGAAGYLLSVETLGRGRVQGGRLTSPSSPMRLRVRAVTGEQPLQALESLVTAKAGQDERASKALAFLSYREKFLAGSWRFDTYFGRDTLISASLLMPALEPAAVESAISSVLDRLAPNGEVAHEEDIGEFAVLRHAREGRGRSDAPIYDYGMVDDDFLLAPLASRWWSDARGRARASVFLATKSSSGETRGKLLARNLLWLVDRTEAFAKDPRAENLVGVKPGRLTGNWRDSEQGLGRGRYAYDVNAALVPAALEAAAEISKRGLLDDYLDRDQRRLLSRAHSQAEVWTQKAPDLFKLAIPAARAQERFAAYARDAGVAAAPGAAQITAFHALSLDDTGTPIPILHSDEGFRLLLTLPEAAELATCVDAIFRPFPAGLMTDAGLLVANPALANAELRREFSRFAYHGTVVWSWQQALMIAGLDRQLARKDLPADLHQRLANARRQLWSVIEGTRELRTSELWSWRSESGRIRAEPFGRPGADVDESNAAQLWSTVFLAIGSPAP